jgi:carboxyl-terminal processing protease
MGFPFLLIILLAYLSYAQEQCSKEETLNKLREYIIRYHLWKDRFSELPQWKDESEAIAFLRSKGDRWTTITKLEEDKTWYSEAKLFGLGIRWNDEGVIVKVFEGSPAEKAGLRKGDIIYSINGETDKNKWSFTIKNTPTNAPVKLEIIRNGFFESLEVQKGYFTINPVEERRIINLGDRKIGYVHLVNFTNPTIREFKQAMEEFEREGIDGLIIDLSNNSGGLIGVAKAIADMLLGGEGVMFYLETSSGGLSVYEFKSEKPFKKPIFVIVNKNTASAAELLASLLKRYAKAIIAGEKTVGKYVGSNMYPLNDCGLVLRLITFAMKFPDGTLAVGEKGMEPDCPAESGNLQKALECFKSAINLGAPSASP